MLNTMLLGAAIGAISGLMYASLPEPTDPLSASRYDSGFFDSDWKYENYSFGDRPKYDDYTFGGGLDFTDSKVEEVKEER